MTRIAINGDWALAADNLQWILQRRRKGPHPWYGVSFVSSTKDILARCMAEKGVPAQDAKQALNGLPDTFAQWHASLLGLDAGAAGPAPVSDSLPDDKTAPATPTAVPCLDLGHSLHRLTVTPEASPCP